MVSVKQWTWLMMSLGLAGCADNLYVAPDVMDDENTEEENPGENEGENEGENNGENNGEQEESCTYNHFPIANSGAGQMGNNPEKPWFRYMAFSTTAPPGDMMVLDSYQGAPYWGASEPGSYSLAGSNFADCSACLLIWYQCDENYACEKAFLADEGALDIRSMNGVGSTFSATLHGVVFREVTIDSETYESTPVAGGDTWCLDGFQLEAATEQWE